MKNRHRRPIAAEDERKTERRGRVACRRRRRGWRSVAGDSKPDINGRGGLVLPIPRRIGF